MPVLNLEYNFLFACNPGTGSTSVSRVLVEQCNSRYFPEKSLKKNDVVIGWKHGLLKHLRMFDLIDEQTFDDLFKFVFVRNPYTYLLSDYIRHRQWRELIDQKGSWVQNSPSAQERIKMANSCSFREYLTWKNKNRKKNQGIDLFSHQVECANKIYQLEKMEEFLSDFHNKFEVKLEMRKVNRTRKSTSIDDNKDLLTKDVIEYINSTYDPTFVRYNYTKL